MMRKLTLTIATIAIGAITMSAPHAFAGEDPTIIYQKKNGVIDTAKDTDSSGYMRAGTKLVVNCAESGCVDTPPPNFVANGPVARNDSYSISINQAMHIISAAGNLEPSYSTMPLSDCRSKNLPTDALAVMLGTVGHCNERRIILRLPVMENDSAGPNGPINVKNFSITSATLPPNSRPATYRIVNNKIELTLYWDHATSIAYWTFNLSMKYTITDRVGRTASADVAFYLYIMFSPLVLDLDGDGIELLPLDQGVPFDINMDGTIDKISWVHADDGLLVMDRNGDGIINHRKELFGNLEDEGLSNGFESLRRYDDNDDFMFDASDKAFTEVMVWQDLNRDGVGTSDELKPLSAYNIKSISLNAVGSGFNVGENVITHESYFLRDDGTKGQIVDAWFNNIMGKKPEEANPQQGGAQ